MHGFSIAGLLFPQPHGPVPMFGAFFQWVPIFHAVLVFILMLGLVLAFRRQLAAAGGNQPGAPRRTVPGRVPRIRDARAGGAAPAAGG